jgi:hypothetical protein
MERQAGLGRSLEDVLDAVPPIETLDPEPAHALFGIGVEDRPVANGVVPPTEDEAPTDVAKGPKQRTSKKSKAKSKKRDKKKDKAKRKKKGKKKGKKK